MEVIGIRKLDFMGQDDKPVKGTQYFLSEPMEAPAQGVSVEKVFLRPEALDAMGFEPELHDDVEIIYGKHGKARELRILP